MQWPGMPVRRLVPRVEQNWTGLGSAIGCCGPVVVLGKWSRNSKQFRAGAAGSHWVGALSLLHRQPGLAISVEVLQD